MLTALALGFASITFFSTLAGGVAALRWPARVQSLMALAGGVVLAAAFFDLLPDALQRANDLHISLSVPTGAALIGYFVFHVLERLLHAPDESRERPDPAGLVGATGFVIHSFFDGVIIGLGFRVSFSLGLLVAIAVIGHDFSDGLNTVSYMVAHRQPRGRSWGWLLADAFTPLCGAAVASFAPIPDQVFPIALGLFAGFFIYAGAGNLLLRARDLALRRSLPFTLGGATMMFLVSRLA